MRTIRADVTRYLLSRPWTQDTAGDEVSRRLDRTGLETPARSLWLVIEHEGEVVGDVELWLSDDTGAAAEIGWVLSPGARGRGFAAEAVDALLDLGFARYGLHRVIAQLDARNAASAALAERVGMRREAHLRQSWWSKGEWTDTLVYAVLADERPVQPAPGIIRVSAVTLRDSDGRVLTVRKRGTQMFMQPGGKPEAGEGPPQTALRECSEELGVDLPPAELDLLGVYLAPAANEPGQLVVATVFTHPAQVVPTAAVEIEEIAWVDVSDPDRLRPDLAPLLVQHVLPALAAQG